MKQAKTLSIIFLALLIFGGCSNLNSRKDSESENVKVVNGKLIIPVEMGGVEGARSILLARSAVPDGLFASDLGEKFFFTAALTDGTDPVADDLQAAECETITSGSSSSARLAIPYGSLAEGTYTVYVYAFDKTTVTDIDQVNDFTDLTAALFSGTTTVSITAGSVSASFGNKIILLPYSDSTVSGSVELKINIPEGYSLATNCIDSDGNSVAKLTFVELPPTSGVCTLSVDEVDAAPYTVEFLLQKGSGANKKTAYTRTEVINVYPGMKTEKWFSGATYNASITIEESDIAATYYVFATNSDFVTDTTLGVATPDNETGNGTIGKPYATVQKAIDRIAEINNGTTQYTIYVDGEFTAEEGRNLVLIENNSDKALNICIEGLGADDNKTTFTGSGNRVIYLYNSSSPINLTLKNLKITGASGVTASGAGICSESHNDSTLTILNCEISNNTTSGNGGGIALVKGSLTISGSKFESNSASNGAGVYINSESFTLFGTADFESNQEIYLTAGKTIAIGTDFDIATDASSDPKKIGVYMPAASYDANTPVLTGTIDQDICDKFILLDSDGTAESTGWKIAPNADNTAGVLVAL